MNTRTMLTVLLALSPTLHAVSQAPPPPQISVSGSAEVKVAPDEIHLRVGVETRHETMEDAKRQNDERVAKSLAFIKRSGVTDKDVQTDYINIEPTYQIDPASGTPTKPTHYVVRKSIGIRFTKIQGFEDFVTGLLTNGITTVHGIDFRTTQLRKHRDTARKMAIRAAREKADVLAAELNVRRGQVHSITANDWSGWHSAGQNSIQSDDGARQATDNTLSIGQISVTASVSVSFLIE